MGNLGFNPYMMSGVITYNPTYNWVFGPTFVEKRIEMFIKLPILQLEMFPALDVDLDLISWPI